MNEIFPIEKFLSKIKIIGSCWIWQAGINGKGYGYFHVNKKALRVHRLMYEYFHGQICSDLTIDHLCKNRKCINPLHLEQVTKKENILRSKSWSGINSRKTHCPKGHLLVGENIHIEKGGGRRCRICDKIRKRISRKNRKLLLILNS